MTATTNIAIAGITSKLALLIAPILLENPNVQLRASCRKTSKAPAFLRDHDRVQLIQTDAYDKENLRSLVRGCDTVICCYFADNDTMTSGQKLLIDVSEEEGVRRYLASDYTGDYRTLEYGTIPFKDPMKNIMAYLETRQKIVGVHVLVGILMESFWNFFSGFDDQTNTFKFWGSGEERWELTSYETTAQYVAAIALDANATGVVKFLADRISILEVADAMEEVYGERPKLASLGDLQHTSAPSGDEDFVALMHKNLSYVLLNGMSSLGNELDNGKYPHVKPQSVVQFLKTRDFAQILDKRFAIQT